MSAQSNLQIEWVYSHPIDKTSGLRCEQTIKLTVVITAPDYSAQLRREKYYDALHNQRLVFLTNHFELSALTIAGRYRCRSQVELFLKWIKQHPRIKAFFGTSENAVKTQAWITVYALVAMPKKRLGSGAPLCTILQILSLTLFEKTSLNAWVAGIDLESDESQMPKPSDTGSAAPASGGRRDHPRH